METVFGGYHVGRATVYSHGQPLDSPQLATLTCAMCKLILREPKQVIVCGHRYCKQCIEKMTSGSDGPFTCCIDGEKFEMNEVRNDKGCQRDISVLEVDCPDLCTWRGKLLDMEVHTTECPNKKFPCPLKCGGHYCKDEMEAHTSSECPKRSSWCQFCQKDIFHNSLQDHHEMCEDYPLTCDYCHEDLPNRKSLNQHLEKDCEEYCMTCPQNGCSFKGPKSLIAKHFLETHSISEIFRVRDRIGGMQEKIEVMESEYQNLQSDVSDMNMTMRDNSILQATATIRVRQDVMRQQSELSSLKKELATQETKLVRVCETLQTVLTQHAVAIDDIRLRQDVLDVKETHGIFVWKIPDIRRRYRGEMEGRTISFYSPPFYTCSPGDRMECPTINLYSPPFYASPYGYRMCLHTYLNEGGIGKNPHLLLLLILMCSEYHNLLSWHLKQSVLFFLIHCKKQAIQPLSLTFTSHPSRSRVMNVASGCPTFVHRGY